jgi:protein involved in polysaccharide export with SLBB domain
MKETGLLVEVKRWVAKDATDHGQIVSDSDLTDDAIFDRLNSDPLFRSVATRIAQRYGYLLPRVNPESALARERELVLQERTKWLAQHQEEERMAQRHASSQNLENIRNCDTQSDSDCELQPPNSSSPSAVRRGPSDRGSAPGSEAVPNQSDSPANPRGGENPQSYGRVLTARNESSNYDPPKHAAYGEGNDQFPNNLEPVSERNGSASSSVGDAPDELPRSQVQDELETAGENFAASNGSDPSSEAPYFANNNGGFRADTPNYGSSRQPARVSVQPNASRQNPAQPAELLRKRSPYADIPSLYDMYLQAVPRPVTPTRFSSEVFSNGTRDSQMIPMDLPVGPDYVVGPGDGLSVELWGGVSQRFFRTVDREGRISLPEAGPVLVSGKSLAEVQQGLQKIMRMQFRDESAEVSLARLRTIRIYEAGDVAKPGAYDISALSTPLNALFAAGGPTSKGSLRIVKHYRGAQLVQVVDLYDLLLHGIKSDLLRLDNGDTVLVPPIGPEVTIEGMVRRPAIYELKDEKNLASVLELAGGLLPTAALKHIEVQRLIQHDKQTMLSLDIAETGDAAAITKELESFEIHAGDRIRIFPIASYNQDAIYLDGHVLRPGRYSYRENMRVTDVIASYQDLLPEPSTTYAEIVRLNAPDFHPSVESFDLAAALSNPAQSPTLHAMDTIRIFSRFDFENPPAISVLGDVRSPGTYRTSGQIRLGDAIHLAGGLAPDALTADTQVFRYAPDGQLTIFSVSLRHCQQLAADPTPYHQWRTVNNEVL